MIFIGDIAFPSFIELDIAQMGKVFTGQPVIGNLEGPILNEEHEQKYLKEPVLFNGSNSIATLKKMGVKILSLANNHILDIPFSFETTCSVLKQNDIQFTGAGANLDRASSPVMLQNNGMKYLFLSFGWESIQCIPAGTHQKGVNPLRVSHVLQSVKKIKKEHPEAILVLLMHWNYELEDYPQPADRQLARCCIDEGADAVIGCHSHCVQGIEFYKNAPIVYSLGNWFIPQNTFFSGKLRFPEKSYVQLAFEWQPGEEAKCHWFLYEPENQQIKYVESEKVSDSSRVKKLTPFNGYNHSQYIQWFKQNRAKKLLLPVFKNIDDNRLNVIKHYWVALRDKLINFLLFAGLKKIRRDT